MKGKIVQHIVSLICIGAAIFGLYSIYHDQNTISHPAVYVVILLLVIIFFGYASATSSWRDS